MKMLRWLLALVALAAPAFAQDSLLGGLTEDTSIDGTEELYCEDSGNTTASMCKISSILSASFAYFDVSNAGTISAVDTSNVLIVADTEAADSHSGHSTSSNTSRYTVPSGQDGVWIFGCALGWDTNATNGRAISFFKNGSAAKPGSYLPANAIGIRQTATTMIVGLVATDYVECVANQFSGGTRTISASANFWGYRVR